MTHDLLHLVLLSAIIFLIGCFGIWINRRSVISILLAIELMLLAININFVSFSAYFHDITGQIFSIFIFTIAAAEAAIGLAITVVYYRDKNTIDVKNINQLKG